MEREAAAVALHCYFGRATHYSWPAVVAVGVAVSPIFPVVMVKGAVVVADRRIKQVRTVDMIVTIQVVAAAAVVLREEQAALKDTATTVEKAVAAALVAVRRYPTARPELAAAATAGTATLL